MDDEELEITLVLSRCTFPLPTLNVLLPPELRARIVPHNHHHTSDGSESSALEDEGVEALAEIFATIPNLEGLNLDQNLAQCAASSK